MARRRKKENNQFKIAAAILAVLVFVAITVALTSQKSGGDLPAISDETAGETKVTTSEVHESVSGTDQTNPPESQTVPAVTDAPPVEDPVVPRGFYNPLTGLPCSEEISKQRPIGIMINNINKSLPQEGIIYGDVIYECLAEGGITRLFMLVQDYASLPKVGSVRSTRDYYLDFAQNHNALFFHAGGSEKAYEEIDERNIDNFDGVRMNIPNTFYRDPWRVENMAYEHTLVIEGTGIVNAIKYRKANTQLAQNFKSPFNFANDKTALEGNDATCVYIPFSLSHSPYMKYNPATQTYKRWQFDDPHEDKDGNQLEFTNILVLFCHHTGALDSAGRIEVTTTGNGDGYYVYGGKYIPIKYSKATEDSPVVLTNTDGSPLVINKGKTYIAVYNSANKGLINMNYSK